MYNNPIVDAEIRPFTPGVVNIFATIPGLFLVDRYGRTLLMKWSAIGSSA